MYVHLLICTFGIFRKQLYASGDKNNMIFFATYLWRGMTVQMVDISCLLGDGAPVLPCRKCVFEQLYVATFVQRYDLVNLCSHKNRKIAQNCAKVSSRVTVNLQKGKINIPICCVDDDVSFKWIIKLENTVTQ